MRNEIAGLHAKMSSFKFKCDSAKIIIENALRKGSAYVALSGGKDSTVVLDLARSIDSSIPAVWSDDEWFLPETADYMHRLLDSGVDVRQIRTNDQHTDWFITHGEYNGIPDYARQQNWQVCLLGLREEESSMRRVHLRTNGPLFFAKSDAFWHCNPIWNWSWKDVWAYIVSNDVDYNHAYNRLEEIGVPPEQQRIGPFATERALGIGQLTILKRGWPNLYNRFAAAHPEAHRYT